MAERQGDYAAKAKPLICMRLSGLRSPFGMLSNMDHHAASALTAQELRIPHLYSGCPMSMKDTLIAVQWAYTEPLVNNPHFETILRLCVCCCSKPTIYYCDEWTFQSTSISAYGCGTSPAGSFQPYRSFVQEIVSNEKFTIYSSFGLEVLEGSIQGKVQGGGEEISFLVEEKVPTLKGFYYKVEPASSQTEDFWEYFFSNRIDGEPADDFAISSFGRFGSEFSEHLNADSYLEGDEGFFVSIYGDNMSAAYGGQPLIKAYFTIVDDDWGAAWPFSMGSSGSDRIIFSSGSQRIYGQEGNDIISGASSQSTMLALNPDLASKIYRLYDATLDRVPDAQGYLSWVEALESGTSLQSVASGFTESREFKATYGELDNSSFIDLLYLNVLGRKADEAGLNGWVSKLSDGVARTEVVVGFSESLEYKRNTASEASQFASNRSEVAWADDVFRLYQATFSRDPDSSGFVAWATRLAEGVDIAQVARGFTDSAEFKQTYGSLSQGDYVELLYQNVLNRSADASGLSSWVSYLEAGGSRESVLLGFSQSQEFKNATDSMMKVWVREEGVDDRLIGGAGTDTLVGGLGADVFVFTPGSGRDTILDFETWDWVDVTSFELASEDIAMSHFRQSGSDAVFEFGDVAVILRGVNVVDLVDNLLL